MAYNTILNQLMSRDTYLTAKCCSIIAQAVMQDMKKFSHHTSWTKINSYVLQTLRTIDKKVDIHLSMNPILGDLEPINLDNHQEVLENNDYFFYKFDGFRNFARGMNQIVCVTGIIDNGTLNCLIIFNPISEQTIWYQSEQSCIYQDQKIVWNSRNTSTFNNNEQERPVMAAVHLKTMSISSFHEFLPSIRNSNIINLNNFFLELFFLLNNSIQVIITDLILDTITKKILETFANMGVFNVQYKDDVCIIVRQSKPQED